MPKSLLLVWVSSFAWVARLSAGGAQTPSGCLLRWLDNAPATCQGPSLGAFNAWVKGSYLEDYKNRDAVKVAKHILEGAAYLYRVQNLKMQGQSLSAELAEFRI